MDEDEAELRNPFPSPPSHYTKYTSHNLKLLAVLRERSASIPDATQHHMLSDQCDVPEWPLTQLEKPRVDWILDEPDGHYDVFGDRWFVKEKIPSLAELGGNQLYPTDLSVDRRPALLSVLRSLLVSYSSLTSSLLAPPPSSSSTTPPDWQRHVEWITVLGQNLMAAANDLRPVQARGNLELMMKRQLELRREETKTIHIKCDALEAKLTELRASSQKPSSDGNTNIKQDNHATIQPMEGVEGTYVQVSTSDRSGIAVGHDDVLRWAEEIWCASPSHRYI